MVRIAIARTTLVGLLMSCLTASSVGTEQPRAQATPAEAAPFVGDWTLTLQGPNGAGTFDLSVKVDKEKVVGEIANPNMTSQAITDITRTDKTLVLRYTFTYEGNPVDAVVSLTPAAEGKVAAQISFAGDAYIMSGTAVRKGTAEQKPPAAPAAQPATAAVAQPSPASTPPSRPPQPQVARVADLMQMMAALPDSAPAVPKRPRRVLVLAKAAGFVHSSIPLATRTIEALGQKTGAWTTVISYDPADINDENLKEYDAVFLASTTGTFLDDPTDQAATARRRQALLDFVRGGKGIGAVHAATDSYHGNAPGAAPAAAPGERRAVDGGSPLWPEFNRLIGGYFKFHWNYPTQIAVKIDDPANPINAPFTSVNQQTGARTPRPFSIVDEVYTFSEQSWSRERAHVLTSIDYAKMPAEVKAQEPAPQRTDHDYALSYIVREGKGRVFVEVLGHDESIYKQTSILAHILAGMQYVLGDLEADDSPSGAGKR